MRIGLWCLEWSRSRLVSLVSVYFFGLGMYHSCGLGSPDGSIDFCGMVLESVGLGSYGDGMCLGRSMGTVWSW